MQPASLSASATRLGAFAEALEARAPMLTGELKRNLNQHPVLFPQLAETMLSWAEKAIGTDYLTILINGYIAFVMDVNQQQLKYEETGKYESHSYTEVYERTYGQRKFMEKYHWGVYVTTFLWEHHLRLHSYYLRDFLPLIKEGRNIVDLGAGSGIWHFLTLQHCKNIHVTAVDISPTSVEESGRMAKLLGLSANTNYVCHDAITYKGAQAYDAGISCFLLEHLENPQALLDNLANQIKERGYAFVTAALTAAEVDHIFEMKRESELVLMAEKAGFRLCSLYSATPLTPRPRSRFLARSVGMVLQKRANDIW